ncbi:hypothetical protein EVAR_87719_1 [Eumeta japonica]|uniref:Uncharacterized protein n=1 Tax=Eumeta variegata TaxID=151549 RepID=A0A4C1TB94_EUMVA|nr:hypothetical protein EVAR_87719_1 [Eumeta japonica]
MVESEPLDPSSDRTLAALLPDADGDGEGSERFLVVNYSVWIPRLAEQPSRLRRQEVPSGEERGHETSLFIRTLAPLAPRHRLAAVP